MFISMIPNFFLIFVSSHNGKLRQFPLQILITNEQGSHHAELTPCRDTEEGTGKSMKHALYILQYAIRHLSG